MKFTLVASLLFLLLGNIAKAQEKALAMRVSIGLNGMEGVTEDGIGYNVSMGFQQSLLKNQRLRLHQDLRFAWYSNAGMDDARDLFFSTQTLHLGSSFDIVKQDSFSFFLSLGVFGCHSRGLKGTGGDSDAPSLSSIYFREFYGGIEASGGMRWASPDKTYGIYFHPVFLGIGSKGMSIGGTFLGIEMKLR